MWKVVPVYVWKSSRNLSARCAAKFSDIRTCWSHCSSIQTTIMYPLHWSYFSMAWSWAPTSLHWCRLACVQEHVRFLDVVWQFWQMSYRNSKLFYLSFSRLAPLNFLVLSALELKWLSKSSSSDEDNGIDIRLGSKLSDVEYARNIPLLHEGFGEL